MKIGRNVTKALLSNAMGFAQTVGWLRLFGYSLNVGYPLIGAVITVPIANAIMFRFIDKVLDKRKPKRMPSSTTPFECNCRVPHCLTRSECEKCDCPP